MNKSDKISKKRRIKCQNFVLKQQAMARNLLKICANLIVFIKKIINSDNFLNQSRQKPTDFVRKRKLTFHILILFLMNLVKGSYQDELDHFFKAIFKFDVPQRFVTKAALAKARMKIKYQAFIELNTHLLDYFYINFKPLKWKGAASILCSIKLPEKNHIDQSYPKTDPISRYYNSNTSVSEQLVPLHLSTSSPNSTGVALL